MVKRMKEHQRSSKLSCDKDRASKLYQAYPSIECDQDNLPENDVIMGRFEQLEQYIGIGFCASDKEAVISLFDWSVEEIVELHKLKGAGTNISIIDKQYRHMCYLCETMYALSIDQNKNISSNPGCEWQLGYYGIE